MPVFMIAEANTHDLIISGNSTYKVYDPVLVVYAGQLSNAQLGLLKRSLGMDSDTPRVLALPGFSVTHQGGEVHHKPTPVHKDILLGAKETIAYHIPIPPNLSYRGVLDILRKETVAQHILTVYGTTPGLNELLTASTPTHLTAHASKLLQFSQFFAEIIGGGWSSKTAMMGILSLEYMKLRNLKIAEAATFEIEVALRAKKKEQSKRASDVHHEQPRKFTVLETTGQTSFDHTMEDDDSGTTPSTITVHTSGTSRDRDEYLMQLGTLVEDQTAAIHMLVTELTSLKETVTELSSLKETVGTMTLTIEQQQASIHSLQIKLEKYTTTAVIGKFTPPNLTALRIPGVGRTLTSSKDGGSVRST